MNGASGTPSPGAHQRAAGAVDEGVSGASCAWRFCSGTCPATPLAAAPGPSAASANGPSASSASDTQCLQRLRVVTSEVVLRTNTVLPRCAEDDAAVGAAG